MVGVMQINFTDNNEKNLLTELSAEISKSNDIKVAVAFLKYSGYDLITLTPQFFRDYIQADSLFHFAFE